MENYHNTKNFLKVKKLSGSHIQNKRAHIQDFKKRKRG